MFHASVSIRSILHITLMALALIAISAVSAGCSDDKNARITDDELLACQERGDRCPSPITNGVSCCPLDDNGCNGTAVGGSYVESDGTKESECGGVISDRSSGGIVRDEHGCFYVQSGVGGCFTLDATDGDDSSDLTDGLMRSPVDENVYCCPVGGNCGEFSYGGSYDPRVDPDYTCSGVTDTRASGPTMQDEFGCAYYPGNSTETCLPLPDVRDGDTSDDEVLENDVKDGDATEVDSAVNGGD